MQIENEIVAVDAAPVGTPTVYTVRRGQEMTVAAGHSNGDMVTDLRSPVVTELEELAESLECNAIADAPFTPASPQP